LPGAATGRPVTMAPRGLVAAPHYLASAAGIWALQQGGNAADAAVASATVLAVVYPHMAGLGGDAMAMVWEPGAGRPLCLNGSGRAGAQATAAYYRDRGHDTVPARGPLAVNTVPGAVAAWADLHRRWGALPWEQVLEPALHYAEEGFGVGANLARWVVREQPALERHDATRAVFAPGGRPWREGERLVQADLAQTLQVLAEEGAVAFYEGSLAEALVGDLNEHGGLLTREDLAEHHSDWVDPLETTYRGRMVFEMPPNTPGVEALLMLNLLGGYDLHTQATDGATYYHLMAEAARVAEADLRGQIGDANYVALPLGELLSPDYAARRRAAIQLQHARPAAAYGEDTLLPEAACPQGPPAEATAGLVAADGSGLTISLVQSLHHPFGSGFVAAGTGVLLHNAGASFALDPQAPNRLEPARRPFQALLPAMVGVEGRLWLALAASGGEGAPQTHVALLTRLLDQNENLQAAVEAPRWLWERAEGNGADTLCVEGRLPDSVLRSLRELGHEVKVAGDWSDRMGQVQAIAIDGEQALLHGAADPRGDGQAIGW